MGLDVSALASGEGSDKAGTPRSGVQPYTPLHQPTQLRHLQAKRVWFVVLVWSAVSVKRVRGTGGRGVQGGLRGGCGGVRGPWTGGVWG